MTEHYGPPAGTAPKTGAGLVRVRMFFSTPTGDIAENVHGINRHSSADASTAELTSVCNDFKNWWQFGSGVHTAKDVMGTGYTLQTITAKDLNLVDGAEISIAVNQAGADTGGTLAAGLTFAITTRTARTGRSHRGRTFVVGPTVNCLLTGSKDSVDPTWANNILTAYGGALTGTYSVNNAGRTLCILSYSNANAYRANISAEDVVGFGYSDLNLDYQRRRAPGHARHF